MKKKWDPAYGGTSERSLLAEDDGHGKWRPTAEEFKVYLDRELEMAKEKLRGLTAFAYEHFKDTDTLHSFNVMTLARAAVEKERRG